MAGFFETEDITKHPNCSKCKLRSGCKSPNMDVSGRGEKGVLFIAEAPGEKEDELGLQLIGPAGQTLREILRGIDFNLDRDAWKINAINCRPPGNRKPTDLEIKCCRPKVQHVIKTLKPSVVVLMGLSAVKSIIEPLYRRDGALGVLAPWVGRRIPGRKHQAWICPTYHPSYVRRMKEKEPVVKLLFRKHLKQALGLEDKPNLPEDLTDIGNGTIVTFDPEEICHYLDVFGNHSSPVSFDYETNALKPEGKDRQVYSMAMCDGLNTISFPILDNVKKDVRRFLRSPVPKIAANLKFEERWSRGFFRTGVKNWVHDTMIAAHFNDNRQGITGLKFQAFVQFGVEPYDEEISPYLRSDSNQLNRIAEVPMAKILQYGAMDAKLTWMLWELSVMLGATGAVGGLV